MSGNTTKKFILFFIAHVIYSLWCGAYAYSFAGFPGLLFASNIYLLASIIGVVIGRVMGNKRRKENEY